MGSLPCVEHDTAASSSCPEWCVGGADCGCRQHADAPREGLLLCAQHAEHGQAVRVAAPLNVARARPRACRYNKDRTGAGLPSHGEQHAQEQNHTQPEHSDRSLRPQHGAGEKISASVEVARHFRR